MRSRLLILLVVVAVASTASAVGLSTAMFTAASDSTVSATADGVQNWVHLYSQSTDPDGLGGYFVRPGTTTPAATGSDAGLAVDLGVLPRPPGKPVTCLRVFTVTLAWQPDPTTLTPTLTGYGLAPVGSGAMTNPVTLGTGQKRQLNLDIKMAGVKKGEVLHPSLLVTLTYTGLAVTYYQYTVPFTVTGGT